MYKIYHNTRCKKSRAGLQYLQDKGLEVEIIEYLKNPLSIVELSQLFAKLDRKPSEMIRKQEAIFKSNFKGKTFTEDEWIRIIAENPKLLNRPIIERGNKAVWGDPVENIEELI
ncbi:MAG: arsenate reductase (glutaredoxin) [Bacteroidetes bacterium]|nr:MAG: arsenate reductase (glutaredoxin) [Bacteroidota bacterium]